MNDMSSVIVPKSDQINADDLIAGPMTITIREVKITGGQEQPVSIYFDDSDKAFRPCKSMSRVLVQAWGADAKAYIGRSLTLYRDPTVKWGGLEVGGIRISHMSHIDGVKQMMLTATKGSRKPFKVLPLVMQKPAAKDDAAAKWANGFTAKLATLTTSDAVQAFAAEKAIKLTELATARITLHSQVMAAVAARIAELSPGASTFDDDDLMTDQPHDPATGEITEPDAKPRQAEETPQANDEAATNDDTDHPGKTIADRIIAQINAPETNAVMDVAAIINRESLDIAALSNEDAVRVEIAADKRKAAIRAEQEKAKESAA